MNSFATANMNFLWKCELWQYLQKREIILKGKTHKPLFHTSVSIQWMLFFYLIFLNLFFCADYPFLIKCFFVTVGTHKKKAELNKLFKIIGHPIQFCKSSGFKTLACWTGYHALRLIKFIVSPWCTDTESQTKWSRRYNKCHVRLTRL